MESNLKRVVVEREREKGNEERRKCLFFPAGKGKGKGKGLFDLLDSFSYTGSSRRRGGGGPCWIPSLSVISNNREPIPTSPTPSPLKRPRPISFTNKPNKKPRHHLPKEATTAPPPPITAAVKKPKKPHKPHHGDISSGACAVNVNKVRKSFYFTNKPNKEPCHHLPKEAPPRTAAVKKPKKPRKPHDGDTSSGSCAVNVNKVRKSFYFTNKPNKKPCLSIYFTNKPNKKPRHHLPKEAPPITAAVKKPKKPRKPHDGDTSSGACAVNVNKVRKSRNLAKATFDVNVNVKTVTVKKKKKETTPFTTAEKRSEAYRRVPPDFDFNPPRSCHHLIQEDHTFDHWRVLVICMLLNMTTGKQVKKVVEDFFVLCPDAETTTKVDAQQIENVICTLGLHKKRAKMIKRLSEEYLRPDWTHVTSLHGIGKYAADAYAIFCTGKGADVRPQDHMLVHYWNTIYGNVTRSDDPV